MSTLCLISALVLTAAVGAVTNLPETGEFLLNRRSELSQSEGRDGETWRIGRREFKVREAISKAEPSWGLHQPVVRRQVMPTVP